MPIVKSLLDTDFYKFTMGQVIFKKYYNVPVRFVFKNRTKGIYLAEYINEEELRSELDNVRSLRFNKTELHYLRGTNEYGSRMFSEPYLEFLGNLQLPPYELEKVDGNYKLEFPGLWSMATYREMPSLQIFSELYNRSFMESLSEFERDAVYATGTIRLAEKIKIFRERRDITFCDFGTRRRFSGKWQDYVVKTLAKELPDQFLGTSNVYLAMKYGLLPMGTSAHEMYMGLSGIMRDSDEEIRGSHNKVLRDWWKEYGWGLSIALTDNYGSDFFFQDMTPKQALDWKGLRQDSGDPIEWAKKALAFYKRCGVNSKEKLLIFSDGLEIESIVKIANYVGNRAKKTFGWGTNLTNDLGFKALSLIVKLMESNGYGTVKLSDNLAKALGTPKDIERFKRIFGYTGTMYEECKY